MNTQNIKKHASSQASSISFINLLGNFLHRGKLTDKPNAQEVTMPTTPTNPRIVQLDNVLDRPRFIWERKPSNNN
jgi:hypothetical protein